MKPLPIVWMRLVDKGETCPRCGSTERNVATAVAKLESALQPLGVYPVLDTRTIDDATFRAAPAESNRIWIGGKPMEEWLGARAGNSPCCEVCGDLPCRTMELDGQTYEVIPEDLIVKAAMIAASELIAPSANTPSSCSTSCCR
ncbi:MAG: hypothetical protein RI906_846 [Pseudomonadota bacterium]|jgi:hypothetical protein